MIDASISAPPSPAQNVKGFLAINLTLFFSKFYNEMNPFEYIILLFHQKLWTCQRERV